jgi:hypothetical protein
MSIKRNPSRRNGINRTNRRTILNKLFVCCRFAVRKTLRTRQKKTRRGRSNRQQNRGPPTIRTIGLSPPFRRFAADSRRPVGCGGLIGIGGSAATVRWSGAIRMAVYLQLIFRT